MINANVVARVMPLCLVVTLFCPCALSAEAFSEQPDSGGNIHFVPNSQEFWDLSKNWTTNYGPVYRDTVQASSNFLPCTGQFALCANSGPQPLPCKLTEDGRFANCTCPVQSGVNFVVITAILNFKVYQDTVAVCGADGSKCSNHPDMAPVCNAIKHGTLIPGADVISTFSPSPTLPLSSTNSSSKICPKAPYAACMTAPCKKTTSGRAVCSCPVFWGIFQLPNADS